MLQQVMNVESDWLSSRALLTLKPSPRRWTLNSTRTIQQTARNCAEQFSVLSPREKCESKNGMVEILSFSFRRGFCSAISRSANSRAITKIWRVNRLLDQAGIVFRCTLLSQSFQPREYGFSDDHRSLGVFCSRLMLRGLSRRKRLDKRLLRSFSFRDRQTLDFHQIACSPAIDR